MNAHMDLDWTATSARARTRLGSAQHLLPYNAVRGLDGSRLESDLV